MSKRIFVFHVVLILSLLLGARDLFPKTEPQINIRLSEVLSIGSLEDDILFQWVGVAVDEESNIYISDTMDYTIKKFDASGKLTVIKGRRGQGPGEFLSPRSLAQSNKRVYVIDENIPGIQVFDDQLNFLNRLSSIQSIADIEVVLPDRIYAASLSYDKQGVIMCLDLKGNLIREIEFGDRKKEMLKNFINFEIGSDNCFYLVYNFDDRIEKFDPSGKLLWSTGVFRKIKNKKEKIKNITFFTKIVYKDIALDSSGRIYVLGGDFSENKGKDVYVIDPNGSHIATFTLPESSHCIYIDHQDYLYCRANEGVTLKKFKMIEE